MVDRKAGNHGIEPTQLRKGAIEIVLDDGNPGFTSEGIPQHLEHGR